MSLRKLLSAVVLSTSLLASSGCSSTVRAPDATLRLDPASPPIAQGERIDRAKLRAALAARRAENVQRFLAYRDARVYPVNTYDPGQQHVWLDSFGNLCAAATIISGDWGRDVTARVALEDNFIALAGVTDGPLLDWILTSGLTHHEIVAIQEPGWFDDRQDAREREAEIERLYAIYVSVERQLATMQDASLDDATDALVARPDLARALLGGVAAGPGRFAEPTPEPAASASAPGFAQPPPG
jgi:hypothetical protein